MALTAITRVDQLISPPGTKLKIKINTLDKITTFPTLDSTPSTDAEYTTLSGDFVFSTPAVEWEFEPMTGIIEGEQVGSHYKCLHSGRIFIPAAASGVAGRANLVKGTNSRIVSEVYQQNGDTVIAGEAYDRPAKITVKKTTTGKSGDEEGTFFDVDIEWFSIVPGGALRSGAFPTS